jgi:citrate lyase beta subunit
MRIRSAREWAAIAVAWNQGIDAHLEALTERSSADGSTGEVLVHPDELHVLLRRFAESGDEEAESLRSCILSALDIEEV